MSSTHILPFKGNQRTHQANSLVHFAGDSTKAVSTSPSHSKPSIPVKSVSESQTFSNPIKEWFFGRAEWLVKNVYVRPGTRYAFDQMGAYTFPRIILQLDRTKSITGLLNPAAALEVGFREIAAGFTNSFLPGLLAKRIGSFIDNKHKTLVTKNIEPMHLSFYLNLLKDNKHFVNQYEFLERIEKRINEAGQRNNPDYKFKDLKLHQCLQRILNNKTTISTEAENLVVQLELPHLVFRVRHENSYFPINLAVLLNDLKDLLEAPRLKKIDPSKKEWGKQLFRTIGKTREKTPHQLWGLLVAGALTISTPFLVRLLTRNYYNEDAFPGSKELTKALMDHKPTYISSESGEAPKTKTREKLSKFVLFPYLNDTLKQNNILPTVGTLAFFSILLFVVNRRFRNHKFSILKLQDWLKIYAFNRHLPVSTLAQMELLYGLLCGTRLTSSRDDSEYRETGIRDCLLGWPTLTYGWLASYKLLARFANKRLEKEFGQPLLINKVGMYRTIHSITKSVFDNLGLGAKTDVALKKTYRTHVWLGLAAAGINWALLGILEPQFSIWLTNKLELNKITKIQNDEALAALKEKNGVIYNNSIGNPFK